MKWKKLSRMLTGFAVGCMALFVMASAYGDTGGSAKGKEAMAVIGFEGSHDPVWDLKADSPLLIGGYGDNFSYNGSQVVPMLGKAKVILDSERDGGAMVVKLKGTINPEKGKTYTGDITMHYAIAKGGPAFREGGVADFIYLHGNTKQDPPVMPKVRAFLAAWGTADIYVNDELVYKGLDGHMMYTERARDPQTRAVYKRDRSGFFSHKEPDNGMVVDPNGRELHFVAHSMQQDKGNFPPHTVWIHLNFQNVTDLSAAGFACNCPSKGLCGPGCKCGCQGAGAKAAAGAFCKMKDGKCPAGCSCGCLSGKPCNMKDGKCVGGCGCGCQSAAPKLNCSCGPGCTTLQNCNCGPNCQCPKDGKGGCGCSVACRPGCPKGGACPLPRPLGT